MQPSAMIQTLKSLKLHGMAQAVGELASQASPAYQGAQGILDSLLKAEVAEREVRSVNYQVKVAKFPTYRDLSGFDFSQSAVNEAQIRTLHWSMSTILTARRQLSWPVEAGNEFDCLCARARLSHRRGMPRLCGATAVALHVHLQNG